MSADSNPIGVVGAGSFGVVIANLLAEKAPVVMLTRDPKVADEVRENSTARGRKVSANIEPTTDYEDIAVRCKLIFLILESKGFRDIMKKLGPHLKPDHIVIHGTKGLDVSFFPENPLEDYEGTLSRESVKTMSEVIMEESVVRKVGCLGGPNLAKEISDQLPAGTVIASRFDEVIKKGKAAVESDRFKVFENHDLHGVEIAGVLKNILAIGSGMISGLELGENARALMITRGWGELMRIAEVFGSDKNAFMGLSGIGDLIATCSSPLSRNYTVGYRLAKGESLIHIAADMEEIAEGINTTRTAMALIKHYKLRCPIITNFHAILFRDFPIDKAIHQLMVYPWSVDVDFL